METLYENLLSPFVSLAENNSSYDFLTERHLQAIWFEQKYFRGLATTNDKKIHVLSPGIWNGEAGPDFQKAHLIIGGKELQGDIEIHLVDESWIQHGHHQDPRYNNTILHISLWPSLNPKPILKQNGEGITKAYLDPFLTIPHTRLARLIDLDLYPYKKFIGSGRCAQELFRSLPSEKIVTLFSSASHHRLTRKYLHLVAQTESKGLILAMGVAMALGYRHNTQSFLELFKELLTGNETNEESLFISSLGLCGFFDAYHEKNWKGSEIYQHYLSKWKTIETSKRYPLVLSQVRPYNHPVRRLAYLSKWIANKEWNIIEERLHSAWTSHFEICRTQKDWREFFAFLTNLIPSYVDPYWNHHYTFELLPKTNSLPLAGMDLKGEIVINTFLPIIYKRIQMGSESYKAELDAFDQLYSSLPAANTGKSKYLTHRFFGDTPKGALLKRRQAEQGAYQLHRDFCVHFEASCEGCPFVERFKEAMQLT